MEVSIKECPSCGAVVMGDEQLCSGCGKELPAAEAARNEAARSAAAPVEHSCPRCGTKVPRGVFRCGDGGTYRSPEVEAAALAQEASRIFTPGGSSGGLVGGGAGFGSTNYFQSRAGSPANSSFAEVADDADFDLVPEVDLVDLNMRAIDEGRLKMRDQQLPGSGSEDDFELGDGTGGVDYAVEGDFEEPAAGAETGEEASPSARTAAPAAAGEATPPAEGSSPPIPPLAHSVENRGRLLLDPAPAQQRGS